VPIVLEQNKTPKVRLERISGRKYKFVGLANLDFRLQRDMEELADAILVPVCTPSDPKYAARKRDIVNSMKLAQLDRKYEFLDPSHRDYNPRVAALVDAMEAIKDDPTLSEGRSPKAVLKAWLYSHAHEYGLVKADGKPNHLAIEESAKTANPQRRGGAPKTPVQKPVSVSQTSAPHHAGALLRL
jgi:hypothetical protein